MAYFFSQNNMSHQVNSWASSAKCLDFRQMWTYGHNHLFTGVCVTTRTFHLVLHQSLWYRDQFSTNSRMLPTPECSPNAQFHNWAVFFVELKYISCPQVHRTDHTCAWTLAATWIHRQLGPGHTCIPLGPEGLSKHSIKHDIYRSASSEVQHIS